MLIKNLSELDAFMPHLLANADGDEVFRHQVHSDFQ